MNTILRRIFCGCIVGVLSQVAIAADGAIGPIYIASVNTIATASGGHQAGNLEIKVEGGLNLPSGLGCQAEHITTLKSTDPDLRMFALLTSAQLRHRPVILLISDDPAYTAYPSRCSVKSVQLAPVA